MTKTIFANFAFLFCTPITTTAFAFLFAGFFLFGACQSKSLFPEEQEEEESKDVSDKRAKILRFAELLESIEHGEVSSRDGEPKTVDETVWNLEALLNARHAHADKPFLTSSIRHDTILVQLEQGKVTATLSASAYEQAWQKLTTHYSAISNSAKHVVVVDVKDLGNRSERTRIFQITSFIGVGTKTGSLPSPCDGLGTDPFGATDDWWFGFDQGKCCLPVNSSDAAEELEKAINSRYPLPAGHTYFIDVETKTIVPDDYQNPNANSSDPLHFWLIFRRHNPTHPTWHQPTLCITPDDMNWYYCNWWDVIGGCKPDGKDFVSVDIVGDATTTWTTCLHRGWIIYGTSVNCTVNEPCPPPNANCATASICSIYKKTPAVCLL